MTAEQRDSRWNFRVKAQSDALVREAATCQAAGTMCSSCGPGVTLPLRHRSPQNARTEIETYWNQRSPEIVHSLAWLTGMHADSSNAKVPALLVGTIEASPGDNVSGRCQVNVTPDLVASCSTI